MYVCVWSVIVKKRKKGTLEKNLESLRKKNLEIKGKSKEGLRIKHTKHLIERKSSESKWFYKDWSL